MGLFRRARRASLALVLLCAAAACRKGAGESCTGRGVCREGLGCTAVAEKLQCLRCDEAPACRRSGLCAAADGLCVATAADDCKLCEDCWKLGHCTLRDGACIAGSDDDCQPRDACRQAGLCTAKEGRCVAGSDDDCARSRGCELLGRCERAGDACAGP